MKKRKLLFVCAANLRRSPTAESLFENSGKYIAKSLGISEFSPVGITGSAVKWADAIFCMENS